MTDRDYLDFQNAIDLAEFREEFRPAGSGPLGLMRIVYNLCTKLAEAKGWDLEAALPEALEQLRVKHAQREAQRAQEQAEDLRLKRERHIRNYTKKHGHAPPSEQDRTNALAKLSPVERKALGL